MNEIDKEYILNQLNDGYIDLGRHDEQEIEYLKLVVSNYENLQSKIDKISEYVDKIYDVMDYKDYPPYLDEIYYTLHPELKEDK